MPNNSCTIILNGHGSYSNQHVLDLSNSNYNIVFPCGLKESVSNAHHNLLLSSFLTNNLNTLNQIEHLSTTYITNKNIPKTFSQNMFVQQSVLTYDHGLSSAPNIQKSMSFMDFEPQNYSRYSISTQQGRNWNGELRIEYNQINIKNDIVANHNTKNIPLSHNDVIYLIPIDTNNASFGLKLSDLMTDILPKIRIPTVYHTQGNTADTIPLVYLDDNLNNNVEQQIRNQYGNLFGQNDTYHELNISGDCNILWDACRESV